MPQKAQVKSTDAIDAFRARLVVYVSQARPLLEEVSAEMVRTRLWLEDEQRIYWENQVRRRTKVLEEAQQVLFSARIGNLRIESSAEQMAVHRAKRALDDATEKLRVLKKWRREFDNRVQPLLKQMEKLHTVLSNDMARGIASLSQTLNTLAAYAEVKAPDSIAVPNTATGEPSGSAQPETPPSGETRQA